LRQVIAEGCFHEALALRVVCLRNWHCQVKLFGT
jgi:hypothetical protein